MIVKTDCDSKLGTGCSEAAANLADPGWPAVTGRNVDVLGGSDVETGYRMSKRRVKRSNRILIRR